MLRNLDRYVIREILAPFGLALLVFTFILEMPPIARVGQEMMAKGVPVGLILKALGLLVPQALAVTIPMAFLLGLLVAFGRLSSDSEWVAMQACGVSLFRMLRPVLAVALIAWAATQWVMLSAVPWCNQAFREIEFSVLAMTAESEVKPRVFKKIDPLVLYARDVRPGVPGWSDVFVADTATPNHPTVYVARRGRMLVDRSKKTVETILEDGVRHSITRDATTGREQYEVNRFASMALRLDSNRVFQAGPAKGEAEMTIAELRARAEQLRRAKDSPHNAIWFLQQKFSIPAACFVFALIGLGFGVSGTRSGKMAAFPVGIAVIFVYYIALYLSQAAVKGAQIPAAFGPWVPNLILGAFGVFVLTTRGRWGGHSVQFSIPFGWFGYLAARLKRLAGTPRASTIAPVSPVRGRRVVVVVRLPRLGLPKPLLIDRYIARTYLRLLGLTFVSLLGLFYIASFIDVAEKLFKGNATASMLLQYLWYQTPQFVYYVIPIAALLSTLITVGLLTRNSELIVMKACGISLYRIAVPLLAFGALSSLLLFAIEENLLASANRQTEELRTRIRTGMARTVDPLDRRWVAGRNGEIYHHISFDPRRQQLTDLSIYEFDQDRWRLRRRTFAASAVFDRAVPGASWQAKAAWTRELDADGKTLAYAAFPTRRLQLERPDYFGTEQPEADRMTYRELRRYIDEMSAGGMNVVPYLVDLHQKLSFPFVSIIVTLIAVPFAVTTGRRGALYGLGVGIVVAFVYWTAHKAFGAVGAAGLMAPMLAAWAPNILFGAGAVYGLLTVKT